MNPLYACILVAYLLVGFQDVVFLPSQARFSTTFLKNCGRGEGLRTTICLETVVGGKQGRAPCKLLFLQQCFFFVSVKFHGDHWAVTKMR